jgi:murein DD-endopeptidase MepM/ murein hydrolase activator NlpD
MKLIPPFPLSSISQNFGENANPLYKGQGLKGHPATDFGATWGVAVKASISAPIAWIYNKNSPDLMKYRAVGQIVDGGDGFFYEVSYGHLSEIYVKEGQYVNEGDVIARVGNTGECYVGQHEVTEAEKEAGSHAGAHLHFQVRKCVARKSSKIGKNESLITNSTGAYTLPDGRFVFAIDYNNGYNGCVNPVQFFASEIVPSALPPNTSVTYEQAVDNLDKSGLTGLTLSQAKQVLKTKYGK